MFLFVSCNYNILIHIFYFRCLATPSLATKQVNEKKLEKKKAPIKESQSFTMNLFRGTLQPAQVFPYPDVLTSEQTDTLKMLVDPVSKFFEVSIKCSYVA